MSGHRRSSTAAVADERALERSLRDVLMAEVDRRGLAADDIARLSGMLPSGVDALLQRRAWRLENALRVAAALGVRIVPELAPTPRAAGRP